jgi:hypothetical protein
LLRTLLGGARFVSATLRAVCGARRSQPPYFFSNIWFVLTAPNSRGRDIIRARKGLADYGCSAVLRN